MVPYLAVRLTVVMLVSTGAPLVYANGPFCRASGYPCLEVLGRNCRFLQGPETECGAVAQLVLSLRCARGCSTRITNYRKDGSRFVNLLSLAHAVDPEGRLFPSVVPTQPWPCLVPGSIPRSYEGRCHSCMGWAASYRTAL